MGKLSLETYTRYVNSLGYDLVAVPRYAWVPVYTHFYSYVPRYYSQSLGAFPPYPFIRY